jgi:hypothetical protein
LTIPQNKAIHSEHRVLVDHNNEEHSPLTSRSLQTLEHPRLCAPACTTTNRMCRALSLDRLRNDEPLFGSMRPMRIALAFRRASDHCFASQTSSPLQGNTCPYVQRFGRCGETWPSHSANQKLGSTQVCRQTRSHSRSSSFSSTGPRVSLAQVRQTSSKTGSVPLSAAASTLILLVQALRYASPTRN